MQWGAVIAYLAIALGCLGILIGIKFRVIVLIAMVSVLLVVTIIVCAVKQFTLAETTLLIIGSQALTQGGYLVGTLLRALYRILSARRLRAPRP